MRRKNWVLRPAHEWLITFLSYLLIDRSLSNCRKRGFCLISKLGLWLFWVDQFQKLCAYMKLLCIRHLFQLLYKEKSNFCNSEFLDKFDWNSQSAVGTSRFEVLPLKFLMHFKGGATSYLHPVLMDDFYPHWAAIRARLKCGGWEAISFRREK